MLIAKNWDALVDAGADLNNTMFVFVKCPNCKHILLYDEEKMQLYLDANDLKVSTLYGVDEDETVECPNCGSLKEMLETEEKDVDRVSASPWCRFL